LSGSNCVDEEESHGLKLGLRLSTWEGLGPGLPLGLRLGARDAYLLPHSNRSIVVVPRAESADDPNSQIVAECDDQKTHRPVIR
jgi:hypothetical protein